MVTEKPFGLAEIYKPPPPSGQMFVSIFWLLLMAAGFSVITDSGDFSLWSVIVKMSTL